MTSKFSTSYFSATAVSETIPTISASFRHTLKQRFIVPVWLIFTAVIALFLLPVQIPFAIQLIPLLLSMLFLGLPHGTVDLLVPVWQRRQSLARHAQILLLGGYLALATAVMALWWLAPGAGFVFFILLTWWHWGTADLYTLLTLHEVRFLNGTGSRLLTVLVRGGLPMILPLLFHLTDYQLAANSISGVFNGDIQTLAWAFSPAFQLGVGLAFGSLLVALLALTYTAARQQEQLPKWYLFTSETALLAVFFAIVPAFAAIGLYFCLWHAGQHIVRLSLLDPETQTQLRRGDTGQAFMRFTRQAAPLTLVSIVILVALALLVPRAPSDLISLIALYLALIAALTLPHAAIVGWLDKQQGVWSSSVPHGR